MIIQIAYTTGVPFLLLYWHVLSPYLILLVKTKTRIIFKSLNKSANKPLSEMLGETTVVVKTRPMLYPIQISRG